MPDLIEEIVDTDIRADDWLDEQKKVENFSLSFIDPDIDWGQYFKDYVHRNPIAYSAYKTLGIQEMHKQEQQRYLKKQEMQAEAHK